MHAAPTTPPETLNQQQRALLAVINAEKRLAAREHAAREPIAVIGLGCRVPGGDNPAGFWQLMQDGVDAITPVPDRWDHAAFYNPDPDKPGCIATRSGGFLRGVDQFDPALFAIAPREAEGIDPQQRLLLEVAWEALEHAGQAPDRLQDTPTGVYIGAGSSDYAYLQLKSGDVGLLDAHFTSGVAHSVFSGRLSYLLGLRGPSLTIDTACSSSLVAVHLACQSLRNAECRMAIAGGVNLILAPELFIALSHARMLAPDGRCKTFDAAADGFARGEGCGVVVLKRLSDARSDGDRILAVLRGSAVNQDGPSSSLTAPNGPAQEAVIRAALAFAGLAPREVGFIEAHGTGTQLGDPLELKAVGAVFGGDRDRARPLIVGSVKTNLGHLEAAAGVVGLIKVVLALQHRTIPAHLHFTTPSPHIPWADLPLQVPREPIAWQPIDGRRIAGVSSFGFSGTNAHVIVEEAPPIDAAHDAASGEACLFAVSARDAKALAELAARHAAVLSQPADAALGTICHTANAGRAHFAQRATIMARTREELRSGLAALAGGEAAAGLATERVVSRDPPRIAFVFTGQGAQYSGMAHGLYQSAPVFRTALDQCAEILASQLARPLLSVLFDPSAAALLDRTDYTQPALFSVAYALAELWRSWGIVPSVVIGHSVGEIAAACVAGLFSLEDGLRLVAQRGRLMQSLLEQGSMAAIAAPEYVVAQAIAPFTDRVAIAAVNGPTQTVISGDANAVATVCTGLTGRRIPHRVLPVSHAFHSPLMEPMLDRFEQAAQTVRFTPPRIPLISNLSGRVATSHELMQPSYWRRHVREAVRFHDGLRALAELRPDCCIEIGPQPALLPFIDAAGHGHAPRLIASLRRKRPDRAQMLEGLSRLYLAGAWVDWRGVAEPGVRRIVDLPTYPFQRARYWFRGRAGHARRVTDQPADAHPLLGSRLRSAVAGTIYQAELAADAPDFVGQHRVLDHVVLPATGYLAMLLAAAGNVLHTDSVCLDHVAIAEAMLFADDGATRIVQTVIEPARDGSSPVSISSVASGAPEATPWTCHATAQVSRAEQPPATIDTIAQLHNDCAVPVDVATLYRDLAALGVQFGPDFLTVRQAWRGASQALGQIALSPALAAQAPAYGLHPVLLDGCLQVIAAALPSDTGGHALYLPIGIGSCTVHGGAGASCWSHVVLHSANDHDCKADIRICDAEGALVAELRQVHLRQVSRGALERRGERRLDDAMFQMVWRVAAAGSAPPAPRRTPQDWLLFADQDGVAAALAARLQTAGDRCTLVQAGDFFCDATLSRIDPAAAEDHRRLLAGLRRLGRTPRRVVYAWPIDAVAQDDITDAQFEDMRLRSAIAPTLLAQALIAEEAPPRLYLLTRGGQHVEAQDRNIAAGQAAAWGLGRTLMQEHPELGCVCIDLDPAGNAADHDALAALVNDDTAESQVALRGGERRVARLVKLRHPELPASEHAPHALPASAQAPWQLRPALPGSFEQFLQQPVERRAPAAGEVEIAVQATGLNFKDLLQVLGMVPAASAALGGECAGRVTRVGAGVSHLRVGDRVMAVAPGCLAAFVVANAALVQRCSASMGAEEAASFPIAFLTASFCLFHTAGLRAGDRVLIHAAAGGVGMAAVQLARAAGAEVFATAGSPWKRAMLRAMGVPHVFDSRSRRFVSEILACTDGSGVDVVLNSLAGELLDGSFDVVAPGGRFVEIGKRGIRSPEWVAALGRDLRYSIVDWSTVAAAAPPLIGDMLQDLVERLDKGAITSLPRQVFALADTPRAFRLMAQARHVGKVVLRHAPATPVTIRADATYLVTGGLSGVGLLMARWLAQRGAGRLVLAGRRGLTPQAAAVVQELRAGGTHVAVEAVDVTDESALAALFSHLRAAGPPLRGIIHCAAVLDDAGVPHQDPTRFARVFDPKVRGAWLLDRFSRSDPLDMFVMFSSIASIFGARGQANYAAANAVLDLLVHERRSRGLCALAVNWGAWAGVGSAADRGLIERLAVQGIGALSQEEAFSALDRLLREAVAQAAVAPIDWQRFVAHGGARAGAGLLAEIDSGAAVLSHPPAADAATTRGLPQTFLAAPLPQRRQLVAGLVRDLALQTLGIAATRQIDPATPLHELGLDSLLAVELRNRLHAALGQTLPATLLFDYPTMETLTEYLLVEVLAAAPAASDAAKLSGDAATHALDVIEHLSDDDVDRLLAEREQVEV